MENFLNFFTNKPSPIEFQTFGPIHLLILFVALYISLHIFKIKGENRQIELLIGSVLLFQQTSLYTWYFTSNYNTIKEGLPLYHCRVAILLLGLGLTLNNNILTKLGSYLGIFGSISALLFPNLDPFRFPHLTQFSFFIGHLFLLWGSIYSLAVKKVGMSKLDLINSLIFINIYHISMYILNSYVHSNYGYMNSVPLDLGIYLPPLLSGLLVMITFSIVLLLEYISINKIHTYREEINSYNLSY